MTWEAIIDQMKEWVIGQDYLTSGFVDRGDPGAIDFVSGDLTKDDAWHDLDLSGIVPAGAVGVALHIFFTASALNKTLDFRRNGNVNDTNISAIQSQVAFVGNQQDFTVSLDANRVVEYKASAAGITVIRITIKNWWF